MKRETTTWRVLPAALALTLLCGLMTPHTAFADGDKSKDGKGVVIGPIVITPDPPKKK